MSAELADRIADWLESHTRPIHPVEAADMAALLRARGEPVSVSDAARATSLGIHPQTVRRHRRRFSGDWIRIKRTRRGQILSVDNLFTTCGRPIVSERIPLTSPARVCWPEIPVSQGPDLIVVGGVDKSPLRGARPASKLAMKDPIPGSLDRGGAAPCDQAEDSAVAAELRERARGLRLIKDRPVARLSAWRKAVAALRESLGSRDQAYRVMLAALAHDPPRHAKYRRSYGQLLALDPVRAVSTAWWLRAVIGGWNGCPSPDDARPWEPWNPPVLLSQADPVADVRPEGRAADGAGLAEWEGYVSDLEHDTHDGRLGAAAELAAALADGAWSAVDVGAGLDGAQIAAVRWADPERDYGSTWRGIGRYRVLARRGHLGLVAWLTRADRLARRVMGWPVRTYGDEARQDAILRAKEEALHEATERQGAKAFFALAPPHR